MYSEFAKARLEKLLKIADSLEFPVILRELRNAIGVTRGRAAKDMRLSTGRLVYLEHGRIKRVPHHSILTKLSSYYEYPLNLLTKSARKFLKDKKALSKKPLKKKRIDAIEFIETSRLAAYKKKPNGLIVLR